MAADKFTPREVMALKELAAAGPRGRKSRAVRRDLARLIQAHYVIEQSANTDTVVYVITDLGRRARWDCLRVSERPHSAALTICGNSRTIPLTTTNGMPPTYP